jgi:hypothetical protein
MIRENADPDLTTAFHFTHNRAAGSFDLAGGNPTGLLGLQAEFTKGDSAPRVALPVMRPRCCLRHLTRFGINIVVPSF